MIAEGRVAIEISRNAMTPVRVSFHQPGNVAALLRGRTPEEALAIIPKVYALCATAQAHACISALEAALGARVRPEQEALRQCLTDMETLRENVLRILLDWPKFLGEEPVATTLRDLMQLVPRLKTACFGSVDPFSFKFITSFKVEEARSVIRDAEAILEEAVFGEPLSDWSARAKAGDLKAWAAASTTIAARLLSAVRAQDWGETGAIDVVALKPHSAEHLQDWLDRGEGLPATYTDVTPETTMLTRHSDHPAHAAQVAGPRRAALWDRLVAKLISLALLPEHMSTALCSTPISIWRLTGEEGFGASEIEAARGKLVHGVRVSGGRITHYGIIPPTQWNFDANGVAARTLNSIDREVALSQPGLVSLVVNAIDPCVGSHVTVH